MVINADTAAVPTMTWSSCCYRRNDDEDDRRYKNQNRKVNDGKVTAVKTATTTITDTVCIDRSVSRRNYKRSNSSYSSSMNSWYHLLFQQLHRRQRRYGGYYICWILLWFRKMECISSDDVGNVPTPTTATTTTIHPTLQAPTLSPLTLVPTRNLITIKSPRLQMTLINMEQNILTNNDTLRQWRNLTSQHVRQYWNSSSLSDYYTSPFYIGRVVTTVISETRTAIAPGDHFIVDSVIIRNDDSSSNNNNTSNSGTLPDRLQIVYTQEITYLEQPTGDASFFNFQNSDIFTIPFEQDGNAYTTQLRSITLNQYIIFLVYNGVTPQEEIPIPVLSDPKSRNVVIAVVTVVVAILFAASVYIYCLLKRRQKDYLDSFTQHIRSVEVGGVVPVVEYGPEQLSMNQQPGELPPLVQSPIPIATTTTTRPGEVHHHHHSDHHHHHPSNGNNNKENVIVSESYDDDYIVPETTTITNQQHINDDLIKKQNIAIAINQPLLPPFLPPMTAMENRDISNMTEATTGSGGAIQLLQQHQSIFTSKGSHSNIDHRASPLRITATTSRELESSEPFMLNEASHHQRQEQNMIGTPNRYGMVTTAISSTVSDLDMNETAPMNDLQDSPFQFRGYMEDNNHSNIYSLPSGGTGGNEGYLNSNQNRSDLDYAQPPPSPLIMGLGGDNMLDHYNIGYHHNQYPHEQPDDHQQQQHDDIYHDNSASFEDNRDIPMMTGFQLEIQDLE